MRRWHCDYHSIYALAPNDLPHIAPRPKHLKAGDDGAALRLVVVNEPDDLIPVVHRISHLGGDSRTSVAGSDD